MSAILEPVVVRPEHSLRRLTLDPTELTLPGSIYPYCDDDSEDVKMTNLMFIFKSRVEKSCSEMINDDTVARIEFDAWWQDIEENEKVLLYRGFRQRFAEVTSVN